MKGFTLIELVIVLSIIGILVFVVLGQKNDPFCFDGWLVHRYDRGLIHKLDPQGKPIPCSTESR